MLRRLTADTPGPAEPAGFSLNTSCSPDRCGLAVCSPLPALLQRDQHLILLLPDSQGANCLQVGKVQISQKQWTQTLLKITAFCCLRERRIHKPKGICLPFYGWLYHGEISQRNVIFKVDIIKNFWEQQGRNSWSVTWSPKKLSTANAKQNRIQYLFPAKIRIYGKSTDTGKDQDVHNKPMLYLHFQENAIEQIILL